MSSSITPDFIQASNENTFSAKPYATIKITPVCPPENPLLFNPDMAEGASFEVKIGSRMTKEDILAAVKLELRAYEKGHNSFDAVIMTRVDGAKWSMKTAGKPLKNTYKIMDVVLKHLHEAEKQGVLTLSAPAEAVPALKVA